MGKRKKGNKGSGKSEEKGKQYKKRGETKLIEKKQGRISNFMGPLNLSEGHNIHITYTPGRMLKRV